ncbi:hypothetical protein F4810DRAFT_433120 [Camillea tinctor]|nr:hypothetical protein F4810DRAFT_433120 [Camillea tinctor]
MPSAEYIPCSSDDDEVQSGSIRFNSSHYEKRSRLWNAARASKGLIEIALLVSILAFLAFSRKDCQMQYAHSRASNLHTMPNFETKDVLFKPDERFVSGATFANRSALDATLEYWTVMSPRGRGSIIVDQSDREGLSDPYVIPIPKHEREDPSKKKEEVYMISVFHQIHCLSTLMSSYGRVVIEGLPPKDIDHDAHCFDLLRQALMCSGDLTVEGSTEYDTGWGTMHKCKDMDAIRAWATDHAGFEWHHFPGAL